MRRVEVLTVIGQDGPHVAEQAGLEDLPHDVEARRKSVHMASMQKTPAAEAAAEISCASAAFRPEGFSTSTCLPASIARSAPARCRWCGVAT